MSGVISRGTKIRYDDTDYTVDGVIAIDEQMVVYAVDGDGPKRLLSVTADTETKMKIDPDDDNPYMDVEAFYHYTFDWETGEVREKLAYGLVIHPNAYSKDMKYILFSPYYIATLSESQLGGVTRDYQIMSKESNLDKAQAAILAALNDRKRYFTDKTESYEGAISRLESIAF